MDRLMPNQQLRNGEELVSDNSWVGFSINRDGHFGLYRRQTRQSIWSSGTPHVPGGYLVMQGDGNLVAYAPDGTAYWNTGTNGNPGALALIRNEGNLVIYSAGAVLWTSNPALDFSSPTIPIVESSGYSFNETSESWKELCSVFPCFSAIQWPGYATEIIEDVIDGEPVVIQLWKGWCQKFLSIPGMQIPFLPRSPFPGGIGAEVGIYRRIPGKLRPTSLPFLPPPLAGMILSYLGSLADNELWWPFPELGAEIKFTLTNPITNQPFFSAGPETSYWLCKWMDEDSYLQYERDQGSGNAPTIFSAVDYRLQCEINGKRYPSWPMGPTRKSANPSFIGALLLD